MTNPNDLIRRGDVSREVNEYIKDTGSELENWDIDQIINAIPAALDRVIAEYEVRLRQTRENALREAADELKGQGYNTAVRAILALITEGDCVIEKPQSDGFATQKGKEE